MIVRLFKFLAKVWRSDEFCWPDPTPSPLHHRSNPMKITDEAKPCKVDWKDCPGFTTRAALSEAKR